jgi:hypothetical protein
MCPSNQSTGPHERHREYYHVFSGKAGPTAGDPEQVETNVATLRVYHVDEGTRAVVTALFNNVKGAGIDVGAEMHKDIAFFIEAIRSALSARYGLHHPFQRLAAELFRILDSGDVELALVPPRRC